MPEYFVIVVLGLIALGAISFPLLVGGERYVDTEDLDADVRRYREALDAGTVCDHCLEASPSGSRFCPACGRPLPADQ